ncbi:Blp family class II bacteriocin [Clostridium cellulovorans]|uniref:Bacteriocin class II, amylovorin-like n=1 Tax=Clostridium cellulovorans (strain ATCC 35296 / DSM 3052 / OCM 3 / 743B) TaxID=573061 RepID=D9SR36_CLOC7|nr:Blp family class II bacteriocin [Clostridium cellulovorans]ADL50324.1 Bacteriocin class II, amylovorin-like [Clostridium cellulovorans 743B]
MENFKTLSEVELHQIDGGKWKWKKIIKIAAAVAGTVVTIASGGAAAPAVIGGAIAVANEL